MSTILLPSPPDIPAGNIDEIVAAANALERAAAHRYRGLAQAMRGVGHDDVAQIFDDLASEEEQHVLNVEKLANTLLGKLPGEELVRWVLPETFGAEEAGSPALLTPYKALSIAVRSEERAFAFWSYVAANADAEPVRALAESMARQELLHAAKFRAARRKAYRAETGLRRQAPEAAAQPLAPDELRSEAIQMGTEAVAFLSLAASRLDQLKDPQSASLVREIASTIIAAGLSMSGRDDGALVAKAAERLERANPAGVLFEVEGVLEWRVERYIELLDRSPDAEMAAELQRLADEAMQLVSHLHTRLATVEPSLRALAAGGLKSNPSSD
jgi:rubrerythrin